MSGPETLRNIGGEHQNFHHVAASRQLRDGPVVWPFELDPGPFVVKIPKVG